MNISGVAVPDKLTDALLEGNLVIFAGAGVSMQPPQPLTSFRDLVRDIARDVDPSGKCKLLMEDGESCEAALGRLSEIRDIYASCSARLNRPICSELHKNILALSVQGGAIRVVTTNFDKKFESAAESTGRQMRIYQAPALPMGDSFDGVVYLHGNIDHPGDMVLTDSDFGKAYVSRDWASRFLVEMFSHYTVLFVGYSCDDMMVHYLARSISAEVRGRVFALSRGGEDVRKWRSRGIEPILFSEFEQLPELFDGWANKASLTLYERAVFIRSVAEMGDKADKWARDELVRLLTLRSSSDEERAALAEAFVNAAVEVSALRLLSSVGIDGFLYAEEFPKWQRPFFYWAAESLACEQYCDLLVLSAEKASHFSKRFCDAVMWSLAAREVSEECIALWIAYFEPCWIASSAGWYWIASLLKKVRNPLTALRLAQFAFSFVPVYKTGSYGREGGMGIKFCFDAKGGKDEINEAVLAHFEDIGLDLFEWLMGQFEQIVITESVLGTKKVSFDEHSFARPAIEEHDQNTFSKGTMNTMISVARNLGVELIDRRIRKADDFVRLVGSSSCLVMRIGLFLSERGKIDPDTAINLVVSNDCLDYLGSKHEVFSIMRYAYPAASTEAKEKFVNYICCRNQDIGDETRAYSRFNIFHWLYEVDPNDDLLKEQLALIEKVYPNFAVRDYPDLDYSVTSGWEKEAVIPDLAEGDFTANMILECCNSARASNPHYMPGEFVAEPMRKFPDKAVAVCNELLGRGKTGRDVVAYALWHIDWSSLSPSSCGVAVELLKSCVCDSRLYGSATYAIKELFSRTDLIADGECASLIRLAIGEYKNWRPEEKSFSGGDWLTLSINHPIGRLATSLLGFSRRIARERGDDLNCEIELLFGELLLASMSDKEAGNSFAAIVFSEANYWINAVNDVFSSKMLPLLEEDSGYAQGAWCGLSYLSVLSEELWRGVRTYWRQVLSNGEPYEGVSNARIKKTFLWSSILYDGSASREELFGACRHNPASCSAAVWVLVEWTLRLSKADREREWRGWINSTISLLLEDEACYRKSAHHLLRLCDKEKNENPHVITGAVKIFSEHCNWKYENDFFLDKELIALIGESALANEDKAKFLIARMKGTSIDYVGCEGYQQAIELIDCGSLSKEILSDLRDTFVLRGFSLPDSLLENEANSGL